MTDLEDDSLFVVRLTLILAGFFMVCFSKTGIYLLFLTCATGECYYMRAAYNNPFVNQFILSTVFITIIFEIIYPIMFRQIKADYYGIKKEFYDARKELKRRKHTTNVNNES
jgi:hypothetical protein